MGRVSRNHDAPDMFSFNVVTSRMGRVSRNGGEAENEGDG